MRKSVRHTLRFLAIAAAITVALLAVLHFASRSGTFASATDNPEGLTPLAPCANTACNSNCWADGTHHNPQTVAVEKPFAPLECGENAHGCITRSCR